MPDQGRLRSDRFRRDLFAEAGIVRGADPADVVIGDAVTAAVEPSETTDNRTIAFRYDNDTHD